jgi:hypothetical protein
VSQVKEYIDKARRLLAKLTQITDFQGYEADPKNNLTSEGVR